MKFWEDFGQRSMYVLMEWEFDDVVFVFKLYCPAAKVRKDDNIDYVKSNACRHIVKFLEKEWE